MSARSRRETLRLDETRTHLVSLLEEARPGIGHTERHVEGFDEGMARSRGAERKKHSAESGYSLADWARIR